MGKSIRDHLRDTFDDMEDLKRFKIKLRDREGEPRIRQVHIAKVQDSLDLVDLMVNTFTLNGALAVTLEILEAIDCNQQAKDLRDNTRDSAPPVVPQQASRAPSVAAPPVVPQQASRAPSVDTRGQGLKDEPSESDDWDRDLQVTPCRHEFKDQILREKGQEIYQVKPKFERKRLALLINNRDFDVEEMTRKGAEKDEENMEWLLTELDYQVVKHKNLSGKDMKKAVKDFAVREEHAHSDSTFVVIMSHGKRDAILGVQYHKKDNPADTFPVDDIYSLLNSENCPALRNKPKVILIQACRGAEHGRVWASDSEPEVPIEDDSFVHKEKDFISLLSCTPETKSYRHVQNGTFYVQYIVDVFTKHAHEDHIEDLFRKVIQRFESSKIGASFKQMACKDRVTLGKLFYLFPGM